jgi:hypothetical protein
VVTPTRGAGSDGTSLWPWDPRACGGSALVAVSGDGLVLVPTGVCAAVAEPTRLATGLRGPRAGGDKPGLWRLGSGVGLLWVGAPSLTGDGLGTGEGVGR